MFFSIRVLRSHVFVLPIAYKLSNSTFPSNIIGSGYVFLSLSSFLNTDSFPFVSNIA